MRYGGNYNNFLAFLFKLKHKVLNFMFKIKRKATYKGNKSKLLFYVFF